MLWRCVVTAKDHVLPGFRRNVALLYVIEGCGWTVKVKKMGHSWVLGWTNQVALTAKLLVFPHETVRDAVAAEQVADAQTVKTLVLVWFAGWRGCCKGCREKKDITSAIDCYSSWLLKDTTHFFQ